MKGLFRAIVPLLALVALTGAALQSLCDDPSCNCQTTTTDLIDVKCQCIHNQVLRIGSLRNSHNSAYLPEKAVSVHLKGCHHVELFARTFNHVAQSLRNLSVVDSTTAVMHKRLFESRHQQNSGSNGHSLQMSSISFSQIRDLRVHGHGFEGVSIDDTFELDQVVIERVPSLAFNFDSVNEFSIRNSRFERVSALGFKFGGYASQGRCREFNVYQESSFFSLAPQAFSLKCDKLMLGYNTFNKLQDGSLAITYGFADIQHNTFESFIGKPFKDFKPILKGEGDNFQSGLVFRENRLAGDPTLPFNSLAMPGYADLSQGTEDHMVMIESNHFRCKCDSVGWVIAAMEHGYQKDKLLTESDRGSWYFLKALYKTADKCVECSLTECQLSPGGEKFLAFAKSALFSATGEASSLVCAESGKPVGNGHGAGAQAIDLFANSNNDGGGKATTTVGDQVSDVPVAEEATGNAANSIALFLSPAFMFLLALFCLF